ncbi:MAG: SUF system NifU family Fe-S cluster assembly protein [bacterium]|nr:SUF system NifU family Fe-S cluster assembly protein [bacterium]
MSERDAVEALYREVVLDHYRHPRNCEALASPSASFLVLNPTCGDQVRVDVRLDGERIEEVSARTRGCSIAVAAGSVMTEMVRGLGADEVDKLAGALTRLVTGESAGEDLDPRLRAFARVADLPSRRRCAQLPWEALAQALEESQEEGASRM